MEKLVEYLILLDANIFVTHDITFQLALACEQAPCEGGKKFGERSVNPVAKGVGAWIRERSESTDRSRLVPLALNPTGSLFAG